MGFQMSMSWWKPPSISRSTWGYELFYLVIYSFRLFAVFKCLLDGDICSACFGVSHSVNSSCCCCFIISKYVVWLQGPPKWLIRFVVLQLFSSSLQPLANMLRISIVLLSASEKNNQIKMHVTYMSALCWRHEHSPDVQAQQVMY